MKQVLPIDIGASEYSLEKALSYAQFEVEQRAFLPFLLLGETLRSVREGHIAGDKISLGLLRAWVDQPGTPKWEQTARWLNQSIVKGAGDKDIWGAVTREIELTPDLWTFEVNHISIEVKIINEEYPFLKYPDFLFYKYFDAFKQPNPIQDYFDFVEKKGEVI